MTLFGLKWGQDLENLPAHQRAQFHILMTQYCPDLVSTTDWLINKVQNL